MEKKGGYFVVSLDFELFWGMQDKMTLEEYGERIRGERTAIPRMLELFERYGIHATWATLGMLMARSKEELLSLFPPQELRPVYEDMRASSYEYVKTAHVGNDEKEDIYHFGGDLLQKILQTPEQEVANHTFSHYYCIDGHENPISVFEADLNAHAKISQTYGIKTESIVFPRNQASDEALRLCVTKGIVAYRGNENHFLYRPRKDSEQTLLIRALRLMDHYLNLTGHHTYTLTPPSSGMPLNVPSSRFLRPWSRTLSFLEPLRMRRIKNAMTNAARHGEIFHLWWHPHNVGTDQDQNFHNLTSILEHFKKLNEEYGMESASMRDLARATAGRTA